ncbi:uncharacterized protein PAC_10377 [Phialocephala subalpina]|uniref:Uncharacterized protein n=1 Tax=Phialocephala subalpina TaxID=576137 RepID=A0A1L7X630_9HELO|nr:uncharacterized protein PAC_10377 [Phialocephala subalpina]
MVVSIINFDSMAYHAGFVVSSSGVSSSVALSLVVLLQVVRRGREAAASGKAQAQTFGVSASVLVARREARRVEEAERVRRRKLKPGKSCLKVKRSLRGVHSVNWASSPLPDDYLLVDVRETDPVGPGNSADPSGSWPHEKAVWYELFDSDGRRKLVRQDGVFYPPSFLGTFGADGPFTHCSGARLGRCTGAHGYGAQ